MRLEDLRGLRGDSSDASDIDFIVDLDPERTLMDLGGLLTGLQDILHAPVDVATERMLPRRAFATGCYGKPSDCDDVRSVGPNALD